MEERSWITLLLLCAGLLCCIAPGAEGQYNRVYVYTTTPRNPQGSNRLAWLASNFPNPQVDIYSCGLRGKISMVCDPNQLLNEPVINTANSIIRVTQSATTTKCGTNIGCKMAVAVIPLIQGTPGVDRRTSANNFARDLRQKWGVDIVQAVSRDGYTVGISQTSQSENAISSAALNARAEEEMAKMVRGQKIDDTVLHLVTNVRNAATGVTGNFEAYRIFIFCWAFILGGLGLIMIVALIVACCRSRRLQETALKEARKEISDGSTSTEDTDAENGSCCVCCRRRPPDKDEKEIDKLFAFIDKPSGTPEPISEKPDSEPAIIPQWAKPDEPAVPDKPDHIVVVPPEQPQVVPFDEPVEVPPEQPVVVLLPENGERLPVVVPLREPVVVPPEQVPVVVPQQEPVVVPPQQVPMVVPQQEPVVVPPKKMVVVPLEDPDVEPPKEITVVLPPKEPPPAPEPVAPPAVTVIPLQDPTRAPQRAPQAPPQRLSSLVVLPPDDTDGPLADTPGNRRNVLLIDVPENELERERPSPTIRSDIPARAPSSHRPIIVNMADTGQPTKVLTDPSHRPPMAPYRSISTVPVNPPTDQPTDVTAPQKSTPKKDRKRKKNKPIVRPTVIPVSSSPSDTYEPPVDDPMKTVIPVTSPPRPHAGDVGNNAPVSVQPTMVTVAAVPPSAQQPTAPPQRNSPSPAKGSPSPRNTPSPARGSPSPARGTPSPAPGSPSPRNTPSPARGSPSPAPSPAPGSPSPRNTPSPAAVSPPQKTPSPAPDSPTPQNTDKMSEPESDPESDPNAELEPSDKETASESDPSETSSDEDEDEETSDETDEEEESEDTEEEETEEESDPEVNENASHLKPASITTYPPGAVPTNQIFTPGQATMWSPRGGFRENTGIDYF